jgi:hypothetical protein
VPEGADTEINALSLFYNNSNLLMSKMSNNRPTSICISHRDERDDELIDSGRSVGIRLSLDESVTRLIIPRGVAIANLSACLDTSDFTSGQARLLFRELTSQCDEKPWLCLLNFLGKSRGGKSLPASNLIKLPLVGPCTVQFKADGTSSMPVDSCFHLVGYVTTTADTNYDTISGIIDNMNSAENSIENSKTTNSNLYSKLKRNKFASNGTKCITNFVSASFVASLLLVLFLG